MVAQTLHQRHRFIAPSYGVNIACVVRHCIASRWLSRRRDLMLSVLIVAGLWSLRLPVLIAVAAFVAAALVAVGLSSRKMKRRWRIVLSAIAYMGILAFILRPIPFLTAVAALLVVAADTYERRYRVVARMDGRDFNAAAPAHGRHRPGRRASDERRVAHLTGHQDGNVVVYGGYSPFKGSGVEMSRWSWSFAIDVTASPKESRRPADLAPVSADDAHAYLVEAMTDLSLDGSSVTNRFYVNGRSVGTDRDLFFHPLDQPDQRKLLPRLRSNIDEVWKLEAKPEEVVRRYADIKVAAWHSEMILSAFVRFSRAADYLFVEVSYCVLPPLKSAYYAINSLHPRPTVHELVRLVVDSATRMPLLWLQAPFRVAKWMVRPIARARYQQQVAQAIRENRRFDFGALGSIRESGSDDEYAKYFQKMDIQKLHAVVDRRLFATIRAFLDGKGVDTTELETSMRAVISRGIWNSGDRGATVEQAQNPGNRAGPLLQ